MHVLEAVGGNRTRAAEVLGIDRRTLYRMAERFGIDLKEDLIGAADVVAPHAVAGRPLLATRSIASAKRSISSSVV